MAGANVSNGWTPSSVSSALDTYKKTNPLTYERHNSQKLIKIGGKCLNTFAF